MEAIEVDAIRREIDALRCSLDQERLRHVAGLEPEPALARLFRDHSRAAHKETIAALRAQGEVELAEKVAALRAERAAAEDEEAWRAAESRVTALGPDGKIPLGEAERAVVRERDRERRLAFGRAVAEAASAIAAPREAATEKAVRSRAESGLVPDWEAVVEADQLLASSDDAHRDVLTWLARRDLGLAPPPHGDLARADLLHLLALPAYDGLFPGGMLAIAIRGACKGLGLDIGRIQIDDGKRPGQWPGAHAVGTRISFSRSGGAADWLGLFRAAGVALAAAGSAPHAHDETLGEALGALLEGLLLEPRYLGRALAVDPGRSPDLVRALALRRLFALRARAAALRVAVEVERGTSGARWREAHREALSSAAMATWPDGLAARDGDARRHAAALAGAAWAEKLRRDLVERYDEDFWRNPRVGGALAPLLASGHAGPKRERPPLASAAEALVRRLEAGR